MEYNPNCSYKMTRLAGSTDWNAVVRSDSGQRVKGSGPTPEAAVQNALDKLAVPAVDPNVAVDTDDDHKE